MIIIDSLPEETEFLVYLKKKSIQFLEKLQNLFAKKKGRKRKTETLVKGAQAAIKRIKRQRRDVEKKIQVGVLILERQKKLFEIAKKIELYKQGK